MQKWAQGCKKETPNHSEYRHNDQILAVGEWIIGGGSVGTMFCGLMRPKSNDLTLKTSKIKNKKINKNK